MSASIARVSAPRPALAQPVQAKYEQRSAAPRRAGPASLRAPAPRLGRRSVAASAESDEKSAGRDPLQDKLDSAESSGKETSLFCDECEGSGNINCSQCKGGGKNLCDHFQGRFKEGQTCWLCRGKKLMLCGNCNGAGFKEGQTCWLCRGKKLMLCG
eukprot:CAMPEP_0182861924 /NCGR_PEP_ID=MMETSP0034_2-20130328/5771_1 /TAXON_ID=156128 /ORGANISM="Nephroselmis pyriformis, Strain CCMP717" /LENGTH=156 /DNA_ID=CAMNT_0024993911 /DNA_START=14 /DNA_END=481 /DNA_ORIENTATION=+